MTQKVFAPVSPRAARRVLTAAMLAVSVAVAPGLGSPALAAPESFAGLAEQVSDAVVNITTSTTVAAPAQPGPMFPPGSPFEDLFRDFGGPRGPDGAPGPRRSNALGSGFVISEDGFIVTNNHVIEGADEIEVEFFSGQRLEAKLIGTDPKTDVALLKVESDKPLKFVNFGDSDRMRVGDWVMAMGNPLGQGFSVSAGIVSARNRELSGTYDDYLQTDAAINRGNSGGPLFNDAGEVVGMNTAILSPSGGSVGIGFAVPGDMVKAVVADIADDGQVERGWLGVRIQPVSDEVATVLGLDAARGAMIEAVEPDTPAEGAGLMKGDIVVSVNGATVDGPRDLTRLIAGDKPGAAIRLGVLRKGDTLEIGVTLGERAVDEPA